MRAQAVAETLITATLGSLPPQIHGFPANTTHLPNVWPMLGQRRRRWADIGQTLGRCVVCAEIVLLITWPQRETTLQFTDCPYFHLPTGSTSRPWQWWSMRKAQNGSRCTQRKWRWCFMWPICGWEHPLSSVCHQIMSNLLHFYTVYGLIIRQSF